MPQLIALTSENASLAGAITYWRLAGGIDGDALNQELSQRGLHDQLVTLPTPRRALRRAVRSALEGTGMFLRASKSRTDACLYVVAQEDTDEGDAAFNWIARVALSLTGHPKVELRGTEHAGLPQQITDAYWSHVVHASAEDISGWLTEQAHVCDAVSLRDTGGMYFVPRHSLDAWSLRVDALAENTRCRVVCIPAMESQQALDELVKGLIEECSALTEKLAAEISSGELGARALSGIEQRAEKMVAKLSRYEEAMGAVIEGRLAAVRAELQQQAANAMTAALAAEGGAA